MSSPQNVVRASAVKCYMDLVEANHKHVNVKSYFKGDAYSTFVPF